ncbi:MAG: 50S ribosomal protein L29 [Acidobacteria bacterium]|nr:50S ribosomal protein L29 [Acidobacteriota bacterium]
MKAEKFRERTVPELRAEEKSLRDQILHLRFQAATGNVENPMRRRSVRRDLARILTVLREKRAAVTPAASGEKE